MSDNESEDDGTINDSMKNIHTMVEQIAHNAKHLYSRAISLDQQIQNPVAADVWAQTIGNRFISKLSSGNNKDSRLFGTC